MLTGSQLVYHQALSVTLRLVQGKEEIME